MATTVITRSQPPVIEGCLAATCALVGVKPRDDQQRQLLSSSKENSKDTGLPETELYEIKLVHMLSKFDVYEFCRRGDSLLMMEALLTSPEIESRCVAETPGLRGKLETDIYNVSRMSLECLPQNTDTIGETDI